MTSRPRASVSAYLSALRDGDRLAELEVAGDPQSAVRATFDLSYATLDAAAARLFRLLGLTPGPDVAVASAARLADSDEPAVAALLDRLAAAHLVTEPAPGRYALHDLLRRYAQERVRDDDAGLRHAAEERLYGHYLAMVDAAATLLHPEKLRLPLPAPARPAVPPFGTHAAALAWLDAERPNLLALVQQAAADGPREHAWLLADALRGYLYLRRFSVDWLTIAHAGWTAARSADDPRAEASAELSLADVHRSQGRYPEAIAHYERALALNRASGWLEAQSAVLSNLGNAYSDVGRPGLGAEHYQEALEIDRRTGRSAAEAVNLGNLGFVYQELGRFAEAADLHRRALDIDRATGSRSSEAIDLANLGETCHALGRASEAREHLARALAMHREVGDRGGEAEALHALAALDRDAGELDRALRVAGDAVRLAAEIGERRVTAEALNTLASVNQQAGRARAAIDGYEQALGLARDAGIRHPETVSLIGLSAGHLAGGDVAAAEAFAAEALTAARAAGYRLLEARSLTALAGCRARAGRDGSAAELRAAAAVAFTATGCPVPASTT